MAEVGGFFLAGLGLPKLRLAFIFIFYAIFMGTFCGCCCYVAAVAVLVALVVVVVAAAYYWFFKIQIAS